MSALNQASKALVIVPTLNEGGNIGALLTQLFFESPVLQVLVVDDGSTDQTLTIVHDFAQRYSGRVHVLKRQHKMGLARAYLDGFCWGLEQGYSFLVQMDGDLSHRTQDLPGLLKGLNDGADLAIGSRYIPGGAISNWNFYRKVLSRCGNWFARFWIGGQIKDLTGGFNAWRADLLRRVLLHPIVSNGYCFQVEMKYLARIEGGTICEVPIRFVERSTGVSKMSAQIAIEAMLSVPRLRFGAVRKKKRFIVER